MLWESFAPFVQFPFRFLSVVAVSVSFLVSYQLSNLNKNFKVVFAILFLLLTLFSSNQLVLNNNYQNFDDSYYSTNMDTTTVKNEYMPIWVKERLVFKGTLIEKDESFEVKVLNSNPNNLVLSINSKDKTLVTVNKVYFPGWEVEKNGKTIPILYNNDQGLIKFNADKGVNEYKILFKETNFRLFTDLVSILSIGYLLVLILYKKKK